MKIIIPLVLLILLPIAAEAQQSQPPQTRIAVIISPTQTVTMTVTEAERRLKTEQDPAMRFALVAALGTQGIGDNEPQLTPQERERFRFHRRPTQRARISR